MRADREADGDLYLCLRWRGKKPNWRGRPSRTFKTVVNLIGNIHTDTGLRVSDRLDAGKYPKGMEGDECRDGALSLHRDPFHGDWNYELRPRKVDKLI
ncbi:MAG: hypothetical protein OXF73_07590 [Gammaproteobacteria bacterium]|nr:hypothetical protein [Gammaproteobacteria bacterium]MCY4228349.1 hypothetical protein [Gammaproteobacteria bacterium]